MIRITCDIDTKNRIKVLYYIAKAFFVVKEMKKLVVNRSHSNNFHLIIWTEHNYTENQQYKLREKLGDDKYRLHRDMVRDFGKNTLFYKKEPIEILENE